MKQNIYDNDTFYKNYYELRKNNEGFNQYIEEPAIQKLLPNLENLNILDVGCGFGLFSQKIIKSGFKSYLGIDISQKMISEAEKLSNDKVKFINCALEDFDYPKDAFNLIFSSLCFHYVKDIEPIFTHISKSLTPDGCFIFSVEHPVCTALLQGWHTNETKSHWPVDNYFQESERKQAWFVDNLIKYHRTIETYVTFLAANNFLITDLLEPCPTRQNLQQRDSLRDHTRRPAILVIKAVKLRQ